MLEGLVPHRSRLFLFNTRSKLLVGPFFPPHPAGHMLQRDAWARRRDEDSPFPLQARSPFLRHAPTPPRALSELLRRTRVSAAPEASPPHLSPRPSRVYPQVWAQPEADHLFSLPESAVRRCLCYEPGSNRFELRLGAAQADEIAQLLLRDGARVQR